MQKDPYLILGLKDDATQQQVEDAYRALRKEYEEKCFAEGEEGARAARKLTELDQAYNDCLEDLQERVKISDFGNVLKHVEALIKEGKLDDAQDALDKIEPRDGEWHYMQAQIYYRRNWHTESKNQLEIALALEPNNEKYQRTYKRLDDMLSGANRGAAQGGAAGQQQQARGGYADTRGGYTRPANGGSSSLDACCNTCSTLICCDCCCECMGGDLIPCC